MKTAKTAAALVLSAFFSGCATGKFQYVKPDLSAPDFVAMIPPDNHSNDFTAPRAVLGSVGSAMVGLGYFPIATPAQEAILRKLGLTDGGQINAFNLADLAAALGTDGVALTRIEHFSKVNIGIFVNPKVESTVSLHDAKGVKLWEGTAKYSKPQLFLDKNAMIQAFAKELAADLAGKIFKVHLLPESQQMAGIFVGNGLRSQPNAAYPGPAYNP